MTLSALSKLYSQQAGCFSGFTEEVLPTQNVPRFPLQSKQDNALRFSCHQAPIQLVTPQFL